MTTVAVEWDSSADIVQRIKMGEEDKYLIQDGEKIKTYESTREEKLVEDGTRIVGFTATNYNRGTVSFDSTRITIKSSSTRYSIGRITSSSIDLTNVDRLYFDISTTVSGDAHGGIYVKDLEDNIKGHGQLVGSISRREKWIGVSHLTGLHKIEIFSYTNGGTMTIYVYNIRAVMKPGWKEIGLAPVTKAMFDTHGLVDLSILTDEAIQELESDEVELLCWTDEENISEDTSIRKVNFSDPIKKEKGDLYEIKIDLSEFKYGVKSIE